MHHVGFLQDLAVVMMVAAIVTILFRQIKQPVVLGYILAGMIIGPHTPPYALISGKETIETLSELGVVFLLFSLGLEFSLRKLKSVGATAFIAASMEILLMLWVGYTIGQAFGWSTMDSVFLGAILSISSTTIIIKALEELGKKKEPFARVIFGILIVEDILAILMIALLSGFAVTGSFTGREIGITVLQLVVFLVTLLVVGLIVVPRLLNYVAKFKSNEMLLITVLGLCFGVSLLAVKLEYSVALGAFLIGAIIAEARQIARIEALVEPVRDMFSAVFFVSIGLLIDLTVLFKYSTPILVITAAVIIGKVITCSLGTFIGGNDMRSSLRVGMGLAQIGEFSFIIAALGLTLKVTSEFLYPIAVAVSALTTLFTPYLIKWSDPIVGAFDRKAPDFLKDYLDFYTRWVSQIGSGGKKNRAFELARKWCWQIGLNLILVAAVFIAAIFFLKKGNEWIDISMDRNVMKAVLWLGAMLLSLPLLIAIFRKLQAVAMLLSEVSISRVAAGENTATLRSLISTAVLVIGCGIVLFVVLILSSTILPSWNVLIVLILILTVSAILLRRWMIKIYANAQFALYETLSQAPSHHSTEPAPVLPVLLSQANLKSASINENSPARGKLIGELQLRSKTGASIVGIERHHKSIINPGPDEELATGDEVLLIGSEEQIAAGFQLLGVPTAQEKQAS